MNAPSVQEMAKDCAHDRELADLRSQLAAQAAEIERLQALLPDPALDAGALCVGRRVRVVEAGAGAGVPAGLVGLEGEVIGMRNGDTYPWSVRVPGRGLWFFRADELQVLS